MSSSNCCFLICIQISEESGQVVWYSHLLKNFPPFVVIHTIKGSGIINKAEVDVFLELICFFDDPTDVGNLIQGWSSIITGQFQMRFCAQVALYGDDHHCPHPLLPAVTFCVLPSSVLALILS